jgi:2-methylcitrate dehydratase PrpD
MSSDTIAAFIAGLQFDQLPPEVVAKAKGAIRDTLGVAIAASRDTAAEAVRQMAANRGGAPDSSLLGFGLKVPCELAAFANAVMASTLDMDDGSMGLPGHLRVHRGHPGCMVIPTALAVAEKEGASGKAFIEAVVVGYEVALATAWMIGETVLASLTGTFGAAAAAAKLLGLDLEQIVNTLKIAEAHCPSPTYAFIWDQTDMTKEAPGWAAMTGTTAALLAQAGFRGAPTKYDLPESNKEPLEALGKEWEFLGTYFKVYSGCRVAHAPIDGVLEIITEHDLTAENISEVIIGCSTQKSLKMSNYRPTNIWQAQYSLPFAVGSALVDREVGHKQISSQRLTDLQILEQVDKVKLVADDDVDALLPDIFGGRVEVQTKDGRKFECFKSYPKGEPENPLSEEELYQKYLKLATEEISPERAEELKGLIDRLERLDGIETIIATIDQR